MTYTVKIDGIFAECSLTEEEFSFTSDSTSVHIKTEDIIGCEVVTPYFYFRQYALYLWYIQEEEDRKLTKSSIHISGDENVCENLRKDVEDKLQTLKTRPKSLLVLINPIGGKKRAVKDYKNIVEPVLRIANIKCDVIVSERHKHMVDVVKGYDFKGIDGIIIHGGDGSFSEVVNVLMRQEQERAGIDYDDPAAEIRPITIPIGMIPTGSGNRIAVRSTGFGDILNSTLHVIKGKQYHINMIGAYADDRLINYAGVSSTNGAFTDLMYYSDAKFRWLGPLRYYVVPLWLFFFKSFLRTFHAEVTFYTDVTETDKSREQNVGEKEVLIEGRLLEGVKTYTKDSVVFEGKFKSITVGNGNILDNKNMKYAWNDHFIMPDHVFTSSLFDDSLTELGLLQILRESLAKKNERTGIFKCVNSRGVKVKVTYDEMDDTMNDTADDRAEKEKLKYLIQIDGEIHTIKELKHQYWLHRKTVPVYTSWL